MVANKLIVGKESSEMAAIPLSLPIAASVPIAKQPKASSGIDKNSILAEYQDFCHAKGITDQVSTVVRGKTLPPTLYPSHHCLIADCKMKPSARLYYRAKDLNFDNVVIFLARWQGRLYLMDDDLTRLKGVSKIYKEMIDNVQRLKFVDFTPLKLPRLNYAEQMKISNERVDQATACAIHYGLNPGMVIHFLKGEYVGETRNVATILAEVSPFLNKKDCNHIKQIIKQGCPSHLDFEEEYDNKHMILQKGNQHTFRMHPEATVKTMNKEEKNSHVLPFKPWMVHFSPWC
jgi:hypothetical protein